MPAATEADPRTAAHTTILAVPVVARPDTVAADVATIPDPAQ
jgi:hypothetical protein